MSLKTIPTYHIEDCDMSALLMLIEVNIDELNNKMKKTEGQKYMLERFINLHRRLYDEFFYY